jgi:uncharacterized membrane protein YtjA (UPF0391 family)
LEGAAVLRGSLAFFLVALVACALGFSELASDDAWAAKLLFFLFLACLVLFPVTGLGRPRRRRRVLVHIRTADAPVRKC